MGNNFGRIWNIDLSYCSWQIFLTIFDFELIDDDEMRADTLSQEW